MGSFEPTAVVCLEHCYVWSVIFKKQETYIKGQIYHILKVQFGKDCTEFLCHSSKWVSSRR